MNRHVVRLSLPVLLLVTGCGGSSTTATPVAARPATTAKAPALTVTFSPSASPSWDWTRMRRVRRFLPTVSATFTPTAHTPRPDRVHRIGALFYRNTSGDHFCSASVVDSPKKNLLITAAHCIHGGKGGDYVTDLVFVPQYREGHAPQGTWMVRTMTVDSRWIDSSDPDLDVGFVSVAPLNGKNIADVVGANALGIDEGFTNVVRVVGYPSRGDDPISCVNRTSRQSTYQMRFACDGYYGGTSGSPWLTHFDPGTHTGHIIGVIGGYQRGGDDEEVSYSCYFDADVKNLYDKAVSES